jgi:hypothetical protein
MTQVIVCYGIANPAPAAKYKRPRPVYILKFICTSKAQVARVLKAGKAEGARRYWGNQ